MIQSLFFLNSNGDQFFQKHWRGGTINRSAPDVFWSEVSRSSDPRDVLPVIATAKGFLVHIQRNGVYLLATVQREIPPLLVVEFLHRAADIIIEYFKELSEQSIRENFVTVFQLLDELLDNGFPHTTEPNILRELIPPPGIVSKVMQAVTGHSSQSSVLPAGSLSNVPWRRSGVRYNNNEIYFDMVEEVDAIIDANGLVVTSEVNGEIRCNCKLSGMPDLTLSFMNAGIFDDCSFHPCVRYARYQKDKVLSFVPPDGAFKLMSYRVGGNTLIPVSCRPSIKYSGSSGTVDISITQKANLGKQIEDVTVMLVLPKTTISSTLSANHGSVHYDQISKKCKWVLGKMPKDKIPALTGSVSLALGDEPAPGSTDVQVGFKVPMYVASGLRVDNLGITGEKYKPYKGVRSVTRAGRFHIRT